MNHQVDETKLRSFEEPIVNGIINRHHTGSKLNKPGDELHLSSEARTEFDSEVIEKYLTEWLPEMTRSKENDVDYNDQLLLELIACRIYYGEDIAESKFKQTPHIFMEYRSRSLSLMELIDNPAVEHEVLKRVRRIQKTANGTANQKLVEIVFADIIEMNKRVQCRYLEWRIDNLAVGYLGPDGTYASQVSRHYFREMVHLTPYKTHDELFKLLETGDLDLVVVPVKNNRTGTIIEVDQDLFRPIKMIDFNVVIDLLVQQDTEFNQIKYIHSHPQAYAEARDWLQNNLPGAIFVPSDSTAQASMEVGEMTDKSHAALSTRKCADRLGLTVIEEGVARSKTTFFILTKV